MSDPYADAGMDNPPDEPKSKREWETASRLTELQERMEKVTDQRDYHRSREKTVKKMLAEAEERERVLQQRVEELEAQIEAKGS